MSEIDETLASREKTHGSFAMNASMSQHLCETMRDASKWDRLTPVQREALEMVMHKVARMLCGDCDCLDHVRDMIGYLQLALNDMSEMEGATDVKAQKYQYQEGVWRMI